VTLLLCEVAVEQLLVGLADQADYLDELQSVFDKFVQLLLVTLVNDEGFYLLFEMELELYELLHALVDADFLGDEADEHLLVILIVLIDLLEAVALLLDVGGVAFLLLALTAHVPQD
jgi:hypothetical protein